MYNTYQQRCIYFQVFFFFFFFFFGWRPSFEVLSPSLVTSYELCKESPCALGQVYPQKNFRWTVGSFACCIVEINFYVWVYNNNVSKISLKLYFILKWYIHPSHLFLPCLWQRRGEKWLIIWYQSFLWPKGKAGRQALGVIIMFRIFHVKKDI